MSLPAVRARCAAPVHHRLARALRRQIADLGPWVSLVLLVVVAVSVARAFGPMTYPGDIWRQSDTATVARNFAEHGMNLFYPQIDWGGAGPGYVEMELPLLSWFTAVLYLVFGEHAFLGRLLSLTFLLVGTAAFWAMARRLLPRPAARWALVAFAASPAFLRWGTAFMPDMTALACTLVALWAFGRWLAEDRTALLAAAAAATSLAGLVKPTALYLGIVLAGWMVLTRPGRWRRPAVWLAGVVALVAPALWLWHAAQLHARYGNTFGVLSGGDSKWGSPALWLSPRFPVGVLRAEVLFIYGVLGVPLAVVGTVWWWRHRRDRRAGAALLVAGTAGLVVYYLMAGRYTSTDLGLQYHVYSLPYAALLIGAGAAVAHARLRRRLPRRAAAAVAVAAVLALLAQSADVLAHSFDDESGDLGVCARELAAVSRPDQLVVVGTTSTAVMDGVSNNYQEPVVFYLADRRGWSLPADRYQPAVLARERDRGARWFVSPEPDLLAASPALAGWLAGHAVAVRTDARDGCDVWSLPPATPGA